MVQNRNKIIELFIGNISNSIIHEILEKAINDKEISDRYVKEFKTSWSKAEQYRKKINPINKPLPKKDVEYIRKKIINKIKSNLNFRISKGYENIDLSLVEKLVEKALEDMKIS